MPTPLPRARPLARPPAKPHVRTGAFNVSTRANATIVGVPLIGVSALPEVDVESKAFVFRIAATSAKL